MTNKSDIVFTKFAKKIKQTREVGEDSVLNKTTSTTYHKGDDSPEKKKIVDQVSKQITVNPSKHKNITKDWKNSTVKADTTWGYGGGIKKVKHSVKRDSYILPGLKASATRDSRQGIINQYGDDFRVDPNPPTSNLFPPEGLSKKKMIKGMEKNNAAKDHFPGGKMSNKTKDFLAGTIAGAGATAAFYPLDAVVTAKQSGTYKKLKTDVKKQGIRRLYRGMGVKLMKNAPTSGLTLALYGAAKRFFDKIDGTKSKKK